MAADKPLACVVGDIDLVRALALGGIASAVVARPRDIVRYSRSTQIVVDWIDPWSEPGELLEALLAFGREQANTPVLYYEGDWDLLLVSRARERLREAFRFVVPDAELVEDLVDKARFQALAERFALPVPRSRRLDPRPRSPAPDVDLKFPVIIKPLTRQGATWAPLAERAKAIALDTPEALRDLWPQLASAGAEVLLQELVPGPESAIESYHAYVDIHGEIAGEFTGRKVRTYPPAYGFSTAVETTEAPDVAELGRDLLRRVDLRGVAKLDFKRAPDETLYLLEINPRFNLWHHVGARAGVNLPALVYEDLVGLPRSSGGRARAGVRWCWHLHDIRAAREHGVPLRDWIPWALACEAKWAIAWDDPMPLVRGLLRRGRSRISRRRAGSASRA